MSTVSVFFVSPHDRLGGAERYLEGLLDELDRSWVAGVVCLEHGPFAQALDRRGFLSAVVPTSGRAPDIVRASWRLHRLLRRVRPEVVHANGIKAALVAALATATTRIPVVWVKHDFSWDGLLTSIVARRCREVIGVSEAVTRTFGRDSAYRVRVIPPGIVPAAVDRSTAQTLVCSLADIDATTSVVGLIGRLDPLKGQLELVETIPRILAQNRETHFLFAGPISPNYPDFPTELAERVAELGLKSAVTVLGYREDAVTLMRGCDVIVLPSATEGAPLVALEAMAVGTPVVAYGVGGLPEVLGNCGRVIRPGDRMELADAVVGLLGDAELRAVLSRCGQERVRRLYTRSAMVESLKDVYREAAKK